jgi:putative resolvase
MTEHLTLSKAAKTLGVSTQTLRNWDKEGKLQTIRSAGNHRRIPSSEVKRLLNEVDLDRKTTIVYARCSTHKQKENLERQVGRLLEHCLKNKFENIELYKEIASGLNDNRKELRKILKRLKDPDVKRLVIEYKDRLTRYGYSLLENYCNAFSVQIVCLEETAVVPFEQELANDIVALVASYSARMYGRRGGRHKTNNIKECA